MRRERHHEIGEQLAHAVLAFAEWRQESYGTVPDDHTRSVVDKQLWSQVSDLVYYFTQQRPPIPGPGGFWEDPAASRRDHEGRGAATRLSHEGHSEGVG